LPEDPTFDQFNNHYDVASYKRVCNEFGIDPSVDFRFTRGANHGLGSIYIGVTDHGPMKTGVSYPGFYKCSNKGGSASKGLTFTKSVLLVIISAFEVKYASAFLTFPVVIFPILKLQVSAKLTLVDASLLSNKFITFCLILLRKFFGSYPFTPSLLYVLKYPFKADLLSFGVNLSTLLKILLT